MSIYLLLNQIVQWYQDNHHDHIHLRRKISVDRNSIINVNVPTANIALFIEFMPKPHRAVESEAKGVSLSVVKIGPEPFVM